MNRLRIKSIQEVVQETQKSKLHKSLGVFDLLLLGIGGVIGTGIFTTTGIAAATYAGPAITLSFLLGGIACIFVAMTYAELGSMLPVAGSGYTYAYITLGEVVATLDGWLIIMVCTFGGSAVAAAWSGYLLGILESFQIHLPYALTHVPAQGGIVNLPAMVIIGLLSLFLIRGNEGLSKLNSLLVGIKLGAIFLFILLSAPHIDMKNWEVFAPQGFWGIAAGTGFIFLSYTGFDTLVSAAEECRNPNRDLPIGIIGSLLICGTLYIIVAGVLTSIVPYTLLNNSEPVAFAMRSNGIELGAKLVAAGAVAAMSTVLITQIYGQSRILLVIARDGLLPAFFTKLHARFATPYCGILITGFIMMIISGFSPVATLMQLSSMCALANFSLVSLCAMIMRYKHPEQKRPFRCPAIYLVASISMGVCLFLFFQLLPENWAPFGISLLVGIIAYACYGYRKSPLA